ncbi:hypothetical protein PP175_07560 [Aneurinibacillus sp. Ricciae_BoGa-3]|uniref:hypothetical protein n=1 Tax=Aneurinibacillus sp. Ricciae_BoGa-3 TaxID=3022697 RepID=UPI0023420F54|nr:hypothetical protein [Aneurinibacillus sp. Ricciae_BoGa-3]WCK55785.1 hypothetical protein PP175_07560 [Aneurinibacillus sp. Ricciae_BoGa-3]
MKRTGAMRVAMVIVLFCFASGCSTLPQSLQNKTGDGTVKVYKTTIDAADTVLIESAQNSADFAIQEVEYMNDLNTAVTQLEGAIQGQFQPEEWTRNLENTMPSYEAAIKHALSIPKPSADLIGLYNDYLTMIERYKRLPALIRQAIRTNDMEMINVAFSQLHGNEKRYEQLLKSTAAYK